jgi:DNA-binding transcriptional MerR regulator
MLSISQIGRKCRLSRSTLLYYDRLKLVRPTYRTAAGYRLYSQEDEARLRLICRYRKAGLPLAEIAPLLEEPEATDRVTGALNRRLTALNQEIGALRRQQQVVLQLLGRLGHRPERRARALTKAKWVAVLRAAGMDEAEMRQWHVAFEAESPLAHQDFLESLGISAREIRRIRRWSRSPGAAARTRRMVPAPISGPPAARLG